MKRIIAVMFMILAIGLTALDVIKNGSGTQFDPQIAELFVQIIEKSEEV